MNQSKLLNILKKHIKSHNVKIVAVEKFPPIARVLVDGHNTRRVRFIERKQDYSDIFIEITAGSKYTSIFRNLRDKKASSADIYERIKNSSNWIWDADSDWIVYSRPRGSLVILSHLKLRDYIIEHLDSLSFRHIKAKKTEKYAVCINPGDLDFIL